MSKYTTELRFICESYAGLQESVGYDRIDEIVEASRSKIFGSYPIFDENYRGILESKILKHYYTREISEETVGLWKLRLNNKMNEIMPYFNKLYNSELIQFDPLHDIDLTRDYERKDNHTDNTDRYGTQTDKDKTDNSSTEWSKFNDTPQGAITGLENDTYITNATKNTNDSEYNRDYESRYTNNSRNMFNGLEAYTEHIVGVNGGASYSKRIKEFREQFLNIDMQVIESLKSLFFYLW